MMRKEKAAGVVQTPAAATRNTRTLTLPAGCEKSNHAPGVFQRLQLQFEAKGRTLQRTRRMHSTFVHYTVQHRGDARHFDNIGDVRIHLEQIGGKA